MKPQPVITLEAATSDDLRFHFEQIERHAHAAIRLIAANPALLGTYYRHIPTLKGGKRRGIVEETGSCIAKLEKIQDAGKLLANGQKPEPYPYPSKTVSEF